MLLLFSTSIITFFILLKFNHNRKCVLLIIIHQLTYNLLFAVMKNKAILTNCSSEESPDGSCFLN